MGRMGQFPGGAIPDAPMSPPASQMTPNATRRYCPIQKDARAAADVDSAGGVDVAMIRVTYLLTAVSGRVFGCWGIGFPYARDVGV